MCETDFSNAEVGDRVWELKKGWGTIYAILPNILPNTMNSYSIEVRHDNGSIETYTISGLRQKYDITQSLFWDEVKITPPSRPKRKVKKVYEAWVNIYSDGLIIHRYSSEEEADNCAGRSRIGKAYHVIHEYEVEE